MGDETAIDDPSELSDDLSDDDDPENWISHPIDIRISLPFLRDRFYVTIVAGRERRREERRREDRHKFPLVTIGNVLFTLGIATLFTVAALGLLIVQSAIIQ